MNMVMTAYTRANDYIRQVTLPLTSISILISQKLFALTTYGGRRILQTVINKAVELHWIGEGTSDMKLVIYIAGNEPFTQRSYFLQVCYRPRFGVGYICEYNTLRQSHSSGVQGMWRDAAIRGKRKVFFNIDHNARVRYYDTHLR